MKTKQLLRLLERSNEHVPLLNRLRSERPEQTLAYMQAAIRKASVAYIIWPETVDGQTLPRHLIIKGRALLDDTRARGPHNVEALPCRDRFEAEAVNDAFGDGSTVVADPAPVPAHVLPHLNQVRTEGVDWLADSERMTRIANTNSDLVTAGETTFEEIFARAELVHILWQDPFAPGGVARMLGKGKAKLMLVVQRQETIEMVTTCVRCRDREQATSLWLRYGDGRAGTAAPA